MKVNITTSYFELTNETNRKYTPLADALRKELLEKWQNHQKDVKYEEPSLYALSGRAGEGRPKAVTFQYYTDDTPELRQQLKEFAECMEFGIVRADNKAVIEPKMVYDIEFEFYRPNDKKMLEMKEQLRGIAKDAGVPIEVNFIKEMEDEEAYHAKFAFYDTRNVANGNGISQYNSIFLDPQEYTLPQIADAVAKDYVKNTLDTRMEIARREFHFIDGQDLSEEQEKATRKDLNQIRKDFGKFAVALQSRVNERHQQQLLGDFEPSWKQTYAKAELSKAASLAYGQGVEERDVLKIAKDTRKTYDKEHPSATR